VCLLFLFPLLQPSLTHMAAAAARHVRCCPVLAVQLYDLMPMIWDALFIKEGTCLDMSRIAIDCEL
jgi:hypothetical protein